MTQISSSAQLSLFSLISDAITNSVTLKCKFNSKNIYQIEPKHTAKSFSGFPYIWIDIPEMNSEKVVFNNSLTMREYTCSVMLRMDYEAKDNLVAYCNAFIKAIEDYESTFQESGFYDVMVNFLGTDPSQVVNGKDIVEGAFTITVHGQVAR